MWVCVCGVCVYECVHSFVSDAKANAWHRLRAPSIKKHTQHTDRERESSPFARHHLSASNINIHIHRPHRPQPASTFSNRTNIIPTTQGHSYIHNTLVHYSCPWCTSTMGMLLVWGTTTTTIYGGGLFVGICANDSAFSMHLQPKLYPILYILYSRTIYLFG